MVEQSPRISATVPQVIGRGRFGLALALQLAAAACTAGASDPSHDRGDDSPSSDIRFPPDLPAGDRDADGLCDLTEERIGSDPDNWDSDGDGMPDTAEVIAGFDASDPVSPGPDQVAYLPAVEGSMISLEVRSTVEGIGPGVTGQFNARNSFDAYGQRASDYFVGATAVGAEPPDNIRDMQGEGEHFGAVNGRTRLRFNLRFAFNSETERVCAAALPFQYAIKSDLGGYLANRYYLLIVTPTEGEVAATDYCHPVACL
jgi:hypothetical protein